MSGYIEIDFDGDTETLVAQAFDYLTANIPGWVPQEGHLESWLVEALAALVAEARTVASKVPPAIFRYFGESILALPSVDAAKAEATSTWTMVDLAGYTIPAGTVVAYRTAGDTLVPFEVVNSVTVPPGSSVTAADAVLLRAIEPGAEPNTLAGGSIELVDTLAYVQGIVAISPSGGVDAEADDEYLDRLAAELELLAPRPILPADFAALARRIAGVHRARAIDNYSPLQNLLTENQASLETDTTGWGSPINATLARSTAQSLDGSASLAMTATAAGDMSAQTTPGTAAVPVVAGNTYTILASLFSTVARSALVIAQWYDAAGAALSTAETGVAEVAGTWVGGTLTTQAPAGAEYVAARVYVFAPAAGEVHYVDRISVTPGDATTWVAGGTAGGTFDNERMVTVAIVAEDGTTLPQSTKDAVQAELDLRREVNFVVHVIDPTFTVINVDFTVATLAGYEAATVAADAIAAVTAYLDPGTWGGGDLSPPEWRTSSDTVRYLEVAATLDRVEGVDYVSALTVNGGTADVVMAGVAPLTQPGTITGTAT